MGEKFYVVGDIEQAPQAEVSVVISHKIGGFVGTTEFVVDVVNPVEFRRQLERTTRTTWKANSDTEVTVAW